MMADFLVTAIISRQKYKNQQTAMIYVMYLNNVVAAQDADPRLGSFLTLYRRTRRPTVETCG